jgi:hypothetical protein
MYIVVLDEIYNFVVHKFSFEVVLMHKYASEYFIELIPYMLYSHKWVCTIVVMKEN